jgi:hypothetical protein
MSVKEHGRLVKHSVEQTLAHGSREKRPILLAHMRRRTAIHNERRAHTAQSTQSPHVMKRLPCNCNSSCAVNRRKISAVMAGLRRREIDTLEWSAFRWDSGIVRIEPTKWFHPKSDDSIVGNDTIWLPYRQSLPSLSRVANTECSFTSDSRNGVGSFHTLIFEKAKPFTGTCCKGQLHLFITEIPAVRLRRRSMIDLPEQTPDAERQRDKRGVEQLAPGTPMSVEPTRKATPARSRTCPFRRNLKILRGGRDSPCKCKVGMLLRTPEDAVDWSYTEATCHLGAIGTKSF